MGRFAKVSIPQGGGYANGKDVQKVSNYNPLATINPHEGDGELGQNKDLSQFNNAHIYHPIDYFRCQSGMILVSLGNLVRRVDCGGDRDRLSC